MCHLSLHHVVFVENKVTKQVKHDLDVGFQNLVTSSCPTAGSCFYDANIVFRSLPLLGITARQENSPAISGSCNMLTRFVAPAMIRLEFGADFVARPVLGQFFLQNVGPSARCGSTRVRCFSSSPAQRTSFPE